jgi:transcription elongation factor GreA
VRAGKLSAESPIAKALIGLRPGDEVNVQTPGGVRRQRVVRIGA